MYSIFFLFFVVVSQAWAKPELSTVPVFAGRSVSVEFEIFKEHAPTVILLPGIYRGLSMKAEKELFESFRRKKINWLSIHFAGHPQSIVDAGGKNWNVGNLSVDNLAADIETVLRALKIQNPVPVSLSYSSAPASRFSRKMFPLVIETAPMTKQIDDDPEAEIKAEQNQQALEATCFLQPLCIDYWKGLAYRQQWLQEIPGQMKRYKELQNPLLASQLLEGYVGMSKAIENWSLQKTNFKSGPQRIFILALEENPYRFSDQLKVVQEYKKQTREWPHVFLVQGAGHILPVDQPENFVKILSLILRNETPRSKFVLVKTNGDLLGLSEKEFKEIIE